MDDLELKARYTEMKRKADAEFEKRKKAQLFKQFEKRNHFEIRKNDAMVDHALRTMEDGSLKHLSTTHNRPAEVLVKRRAFNVKGKDDTVKRLLKEIYVEEIAKGRGDRGR